MWEDGDLLVFVEYIGFGGPGWYRSLETSYKEEVEHVLKAVPLLLGVGAVALAG